MTGETTPMAALAASDKVMAGLIARIGPMDLERRRRRRQAARADGTGASASPPKPDAYGALLRAVVGQQLSVKAAATIFERVLAVFGGRMPSAPELLEADPEALRAAGLSGRKVEYLKDLAAHVTSGELEVERLGELPDETVVAELTAVRGLGVWTAHMFLIFHLERPDVLPVGDLGIRNAIRNEYGLEAAPAADEMGRIAERWRPHRTLACLYLWESLANAPA